MKPRRAMFSSEPAVVVSATLPRVSSKRIAMSSSLLRVPYESSSILKGLQATSSILKKPRTSCVPAATRRLLTRSTSNADREAILMIEQDVSSLEVVKAQTSSQSQDVMYTNPTLPDATATRRRIERLCNAAKFTSPHGECTLTMRAGARKAEAARATARARQLKDFNIRLKSCSPKTSRPQKAEPDLGVVELEPLEKYEGLQSLLFPGPVNTVPYMPAAYYETRETQVDCGHGQGLEVGDFDQEAQPHVSMLVGKMVLEAMWEVLEHDELRADKERHRRMAAFVAADRAELTRLENQDQRLVDEKKRRIEQFRKACREHEEVAAMLEVLARLIPEHPWVELQVLEGFRKAGYLLEDIKETVGRDAMPWIWKETNEILRAKVGGRDLLNDMVDNICTVRTVIHEILGRITWSEAPVSSDSSCSGYSEDGWEIKDIGEFKKKDVVKKKEKTVCVDGYIAEVEDMVSILTAATALTTHTAALTETTTLLSWSKALYFNNAGPNKMYFNEDEPLPPS